MVETHAHTHKRRVTHALAHPGSELKNPIRKWQSEWGTASSVCLFMGMFGLEDECMLCFFPAPTSNNLLWLQIAAKAINDIIGATSGQTDRQTNERPTDGCNHMQAQLHPVAVSISICRGRWPTTDWAAWAQRAGQCICLWLLLLGIILI